MINFKKHRLTDSAIYNFALRIAAVSSDRQIFASGTGVTIAGNLVITAKHVIEDFMEKFGYNIKEKLMTPDFDLWAIQITSDKDLYAIWKCHEIYFCPFSDIAVMHIAPLEEKAVAIKKLMSCRIKLFSPKIGDKVTAFGYRGLNNGSITNIDDSGTAHHEINDEPYVSEGIITEIYHEAKNPSRTKSPCFIVNFRSDGGMSGGPVFTEEGLLCGIQSSSIPAYDEKDSHTTYVCSLWPLLGTKINIDRGEKYLRNVEYYMLDLAKDGLLGTDGGWKNININKKDNTITFYDKSN